MEPLHLLHLTVTGSTPEKGVSFWKGLIPLQRTVGLITLFVNKVAIPEESVEPSLFRAALVFPVLCVINIETRRVK